VWLEMAFPAHVATMRVEVAFSVPVLIPIPVSSFAEMLPGKFHTVGPVSIPRRLQSASRDP